MKVIGTKVYEYAELSDKAKEAARDWLRAWYPDHEWWESVYDDADTVGLKISGFDTGRGNSIDIAFNRGGAYDTAKAVMENHGETCDTYKLAAAFLKHTEEDQEALTDELLHQLGEEYLSMLRKELEYLESDESLEEMIEGNEYTFTEDGKQFG